MMLSSVDDINSFGRKFHGELKVVVGELSSTRWFRDAILPVVNGDWRKIKKQVMKLLQEMPRRELLIRQHIRYSDLV